jgi:hypothetical protein
MYGRQMDCRKPVFVLQVDVGGSREEYVHDRHFRRLALPSERKLHQRRLFRCVLNVRIDASRKKGPHDLEAIELRRHMERRVPRGSMRLRSRIGFPIQQQLHDI